MKKIIIAAILSSLCLTLTACGDSEDGSSSSAVQSTPAKEDLDPDKVAEEIKSSIELPLSMRALSAGELEDYVFVDPADVSKFHAEICAAGSSPDEFGIFVAKSAASAANIKSKLEQRIAAQKKMVEDYPLIAEKMVNVESAKIVVSGNNVFYSICADNAKAREIFAKY